MATEPTSTTRVETGANRRSRVYRVRGVTLRHHDLGETDRILTVFTQEHGKRRFVAKGIRRPGSSLAGQLEPFMDFHGLAARGRTLDILSQATADRAFRAMRADERRIATAGLVAELVDSLTADDQELPNVYQLLVATLELLNQDQDPLRVTVVFTYSLLRELGYRPELFECGRCGRELEPVPNAFDAIAGTVVCDRCQSNTPQSRPLSVNGLKLLRLLDKGDIQRILRLRSSQEVFQEVDGLLAWYVATIVGRESTARRVIREMRLDSERYDSTER